MTAEDRSRPLGSYGFVCRQIPTNRSCRHRQLPPDPAIRIDGQRLNKCLDSLEGLSGQ
jgi:hypothetical protein